LWHDRRIGLAVVQCPPWKSASVRLDRNTVPSPGAVAEQPRRGRGDSGRFEADDHHRSALAPLASSRLPCVVSALRKHEELAMKTLIGAAVVAGGLALAGLAAIGPAAAASPKAGVQAIDASKATDFSARRRYRHHYHYGYSRPYYLGRPTYYRPYPYYAAAPFPFGVGFGPGVWP
jgi:hypothetical protein